MIAKTAEPARPAYAVPAVEKALDIIELVATRSTGLTGSQIAAELDRSASELFRTLQCLERRGILERRQPGDRFGLTMRLLELALSYPPVDRLLTSAVPLMQDVATRIRQSCHLAVREGAHILIVAQVPSPAAVGFGVRRGARFGLATSVSGRVLLSFCGTVERSLWLKAVERDPGSPPVPADLDARLEEIRQRGYELVDSAVCPGVTDVAVPVFDDSGGAVAAMTVPYFPTPETSTPIGDVPGLLRDAARTVSESLGGRSWTTP